jgi:dolichol-phosphate mannosyltransferase
MEAAQPAPYLSLVIPAYNEQENIPVLLQRVSAALAQTGRPFEVLIVDDGSSDDTPRLLADGMRQYPWLRVLRMARNGGQSAAFEAGFEAARGEVIATIDADLQNDPEEIPRLLPLLDGYDMVTGWRRDRQDTPFRRWQSRQANRIRNWISQETVQDSASSLKLYKAHAIKGLKLFNGAHRFFPTLVKMRGHTVREEPVKHSQRYAGTAKYGFRNRAFRAFVDLLAVRWMKKRYLRYQADEVTRGAGSGTPRASMTPLRIYRRSDPRFLPHLYQDGSYHVHERDQGVERNRAEFATRLSTLDEVAELLRTGRYVLRMSPGGNSQPVNLIAPEDIEVVREQAGGEPATS